MWCLVQKENFSDILVSDLFMTEKLFSYSSPTFATPCNNLLAAEIWFGTVS